MALEFETKIDQASLQIVNALKNIAKLVKESVELAVEDTGKHIINEWKQASDSSSVPGNFSEAYKNKKERFGLHREDFQRLGKSDFRSYYNSIDVIRFGDSWFIGISDSKPAYEIKYLPNNKFEVKSASYSLADVAEKLEQKHPLWQKLASENTSWLSNKIITRLQEKLSKFI